MSAPIQFSSLRLSSVPIHPLLLVSSNPSSATDLPLHNPPTEPSKLTSPVPNSIFLTHADDLVFWLTDTTRSEPAECGSKAAWALSGTLAFDDGISSVVQLPGNVIDLLRAIYDCGKDFIEN